MEPIQGRKTFHLAKSPAPAYVKTRVRQAASRRIEGIRSRLGDLMNDATPVTSPLTRLPEEQRRSMSTSSSLSTNAQLTALPRSCGCYSLVSRTAIWQRSNFNYRDPRSASTLCLSRSSCGGDHARPSDVQWDRNQFGTHANQWGISRKVSAACSEPDALKAQAWTSAGSATSPPP